METKAHFLRRYNDGNYFYPYFWNYDFLGQFPFANIKKVPTATILFVIMIVLSIRGPEYVSAQYNQRCANESYACYHNIKISLDEEIVCRSTQNYLNCLNNAAKHCDVNGALLQDLIEKARGQIPLHCSASSSSTSAISAICLFLATLFSMLLQC